MGRKRGDVGRVQTSFIFFLLLSFLLTCSVVHCEEVESNLDNEVPALTHTKIKDKSLQPTERPVEDNKVEQQQEDDKNIGDESQIVPKTGDTKLDPQDADGLKPETEGDPDKTAKDKSTAELLDTKTVVNNPDEVVEDQKSKADETEQKSKADETEQKDEGNDQDSETSKEAESKPEAEDKKDPEKEGDSVPKDDSKHEIVPQDTAITNNTSIDSNTKQNTSKPDDKDTDDTLYTVNIPDVTSPSLAEQLPKDDQSHNADNRPKKYFPTLVPKVVNPESDSDFSFFRLFILTTVVFVFLYVGYYYRHIIKRHFNKNGNDIYYQPLRTMQHNAVD
ncbi:uncharacterized protein LOC134815792 [Bolinopsis microptera]|uniref:uncharacterized protein LOC134815792 n=1 Tax=Bolinopsis microptera TaxID=2820187 RepID=UPI003079ADEE